MAVFLHQWSDSLRGVTALHEKANHPPIASRYNILQKSIGIVGGWASVVRLSMNCLIPVILISINMFLAYGGLGSFHWRQKRENRMKIIRGPCQSYL